MINPTILYMLIFILLPSSFFLLYIHLFLLPSFSGMSSILSPTATMQ